MTKPLIFCWSGGKDSALALHALRQGDEFEVAGLLTTITAGHDRVSMHGVRRELLHAQAAALELPLHEVMLTPSAGNAEYEREMGTALERFRAAGIGHIGFGDIFLEDLRQYRERNLARVAMQAVFPVWGRDTDELVTSFYTLGFRALTVVVDPRVLPQSFVGREIDAGFVRELPAGVDPCGENGEYHSFVYDGPIFARPVPVQRGAVVPREGFVFCDLLPQASPAPLPAAV